MAEVRLSFHEVADRTFDRSEGLAFMQVTTVEIFRSGFLCCIPGWGISRELDYFSCFEFIGSQ